MSPGSPVGGTYSGPGVTGNQFDPSVAGQGTWNIVYSYTDGNGCTNTATQQITVDLCTGMNFSVNGNGIAIYPNPSDGIITVEGSGEVTIVNLLGEKVAETTISGKTQIDLGQVPEGIYILHLKTGTGLITRKIIKE